MKILFVGSDPDTAALCDALGGAAEVTHCTNAATALGTVHTADPSFEWIFVESVEMRAWAQLTRTLAPASKVVAMQHRQPGREAPRPLVCGVETTPDGLKLLRCALQHAAPSMHDTDPTCPVVFEYHAPCKKVV